MKTHFFTIKTAGTAEFKDRGSRFIANIFPCENIEAFKSVLQQVKKDHPKAVHNCFAYRMGIEGELFRSSDDGEPAGSAGKPIFNQLLSKELTDTAIIITRYFGGTLLGVPGLINAYKTASSLAIQVVPIVQKPVLKTFTLEFDYNRINDLITIAKQLDGEILHKEINLFSKIKIGIPVLHSDRFISRIADLQGVSIQR